MECLLAGPPCRPIEGHDVEQDEKEIDANAESRLWPIVVPGVEDCLGGVLRPGQLQVENPRIEIQDSEHHPHNNGRQRPEPPPGAGDLRLVPLLLAVGLDIQLLHGRLPGAYAMAVNGR